MSYSFCIPGREIRTKNWTRYPYYYGREYPENIFTFVNYVVNRVSFVGYLLFTSHNDNDYNSVIIFRKDN